MGINENPVDPGIIGVIGVEIGNGSNGPDIEFRRESDYNLATAKQSGRRALKMRQLETDLMDGGMADHIVR